MARPPKSSLPEEDLEEEEEPYYGEEFTPRYDLSSQREEAVRMEGKKGNTNTPRSKHSETEQRRRSKINERFQVLRDLIPQNDQRRDKASFLLEVIEYINFLQDKLQMYEGAYQEYKQEPTKLTPWRNNTGSVGSHVEPSQVMRNGTSHENNVLVNLGMLATAQNSLQADTENAENAAVPAQMETSMFASVGRVDISAFVQEPLPSIANMASHTEPQLLPPVPFDYALTQNEHGQRTIDKEPESLSREYSQGVLYTLTQALGSSGVDLSQASISVQIDLGKRAGATGIPSSSKDNENHQPSSQAAEVRAGDRNYGEESDHQPHKRPRTENSLSSIGDKA